MSGRGYALGTISMVLFWGLLIAAVIAGVRWLSHTRQAGTPPSPTSSGPQPPAAEQVLAERFARGEIDAEEYRARLETLRDGTRPTGS